MRAKARARSDFVLMASIAASSPASGFSPSDSTRDWSMKLA